MPDITQITDSINKKYVQLPDGTFAEKIVVVNSDGTAISAGGGGGSTNTTVIQHPEDGSTLTITLAAPTLGKVYRYADNFASSKDGTVQFVPTLLTGQNTSYFIGRMIGPGGVGGVSGISGGPSYSTTSVTSATNIWEFTYIGETVFSEQTFAIYNTTHYRNLGG